MIVRDLAVWSLVALLAWAAWGDIRRFLIPNRISLAIVGLFVAYLPVSGLSIVDAAWSVAVAAGLFAVGVMLFARGVVGGGDVKLLAATGLWAGPAMLFDYLLVTTLAGGALALAIVLRSMVLLHAPAGVADGASQSRSISQTGLPYGVAIAAGGVYVALTILAA